MAGSGVVTVGRRAYAVGLYWENSPAGRVSLAAKEAARQPGQQAEFFAVRPGNKEGRLPQFGLGQASAGQKAGMPAFAGCLAQQQQGSWAGAFRLKEGVVVTVVRDELIVPDGDQIFTSENEARDRLLQEISFGGLQRVYAPESWGIPGVDTMPVSLLLDERRDVRLQYVTVPRSTYIIGGIVATLIIGGLGVNWYIQAEEEKKAAMLAAQAEARRRAAAMLPGVLQQQPEYPPPERKWEKLPPALSVVNACHDALAQIPAIVAGWRMTLLKCDGNSINISWAREKGPSRPPEGSTVNEGATQASLSIPLNALEPRGPEQLIAAAEVTKRYLLQDWQTNLVHAQDDPLPKPPPGFTGAWNPPPAPWVKRSFTFSITQLPASLPYYFDGLPGVIVETLTFSPSNNGVSGSWSVQGVIYENRN
ncbi:MAG: type 4b pilus protein PilO2 [Alphaproteobacteria bacterium]|nr:type 4b pilus protein PilO2 [Alphaproteobacteria bacterium]